MEPYSLPFVGFNDGDLQLLYYLALGVTGLLTFLLLTFLGSLTRLCLDLTHVGDGGCGKASRRYAARPSVAPTLGFLLRLSAAASGFLLGIAAGFFL